VPKGQTREEYRQWQEQVAQIESANARAAAEEALAGPLTAAQKQARYRARKRGEHVPQLKPGPQSREDRLRAALLDAEARIRELEEENAELKAALNHQRRRR
jgi:hypothetical protein